MSSITKLMSNSCHAIQLLFLPNFLFLFLKGQKIFVLSFSLLLSSLSIVRVCVQIQLKIVAFAACLIWIQKIWTLPLKVCFDPLKHKKATYFVTHLKCTFYKIKMGCSFSFHFHKLSHELTVGKKEKGVVFS